MTSCSARHAASGYIDASVRLRFPKSTLALLARFAIAAILLTTAGHSHADTLEQALTAAYQSNPQLLAERAQLRATDEDVPQALSNWRPTVEITGQQGVLHQSSKQDCGKAPDGVLGRDCNYSALNTMANLWPQSYGLTVTQPLYRGGQTEAATRQAIDKVRAERANLVAVEQNVFMSVVTDYMNDLQAQKLVQLAVDYEHQLRDDVVNTRHRFDAQELTLTDVSQAEAYYAQALTSRRTAEIQLQTARIAYQRDVGILPGVLIEPIRLPALPSQDQLESDVERNNPSVIQAQFVERAAERNVRVIKGQSLPSLSLQGSAVRAKETELQSGLQRDEFEALVNLSVPLYQAGSIKSSVHQAEETVEYQRDQLDDVRRAAIQTAQQAWQQMEGDQSLIVTLDEQVKANEAAVEGIRHEAIVGDRTVFDLLIQEQGLYQAQVSLIQAHHDAIVAQFTVAQALGDLTAQALNLPVDYYDPMAHFQADRNPDSILPDIWPFSH